MTRIHLHRTTSTIFVDWIWLCPDCGAKMSAGPSENRTEQQIRADPTCGKCRDKASQWKAAQPKQTDLFS